jgi:8-oxo-dGTP pyrophosphatase MutT (NUDIX family)
MIFRRGKWDLPKGKLDPGESLEACAKREVKEETGLKELNQEGGLFLTTYHTYDENGKHLLKDTHWYKFKAPGKQSLNPQEEEEITKIEWVDKAEAKKYSDQTYPLIRVILIEGGIIP